MEFVKRIKGLASKVWDMRYDGESGHPLIVRYFVHLFVIHRIYLSSRVEVIRAMYVQNWS